MKMFKTAFLSLINHKHRTMLLVIVLTFSAFLTLLGLTIMFTLNENLRKSLTESISGDIVIHSSLEESSVDMVIPLQDIKPMEDFDPTLDILRKNEDVERFTPLIKGIGMVYDPKTEEYKIPILLIGTNIEEHLQIFTKIKLVEGTWVPEGENGILLNRQFLKNISRFTEVSELKIGNKIKMASFKDTGTQSIIETTIYGIIDSDTDNLLSSANLIDLKTFQKMAGYDAASKVLTIEQKQFLEQNKKYISEEISEDDLFADFGISEVDKTSSSIIDKKIEMTIDESEVIEGTGETDFIIVRVKHPSKINGTVEELNNSFEQSNIEAKAVSYIDSSGHIGSFSSLMEIIVTVILLIIQIISMIIIMNSVLMGVIERTNEIGTMRAIGAKKSYIFRLIFSESFILAVVSAVIGIIFALISIGLLSIFTIKATNPVMMMLFGGACLYPMLTISNIILSISLVIIVTLFATVYPLVIATKISPIKAMTKV